LQIASEKQNKLLGNWIREESDYQIALTYSEKKIGDYDREDMTKLVEVMAQWRLYLGVSTESTETELIVICQFIYDNFKRFTLSDIKLAMNWTISGAVDLEYVSVKVFSSYYVSRALNSYEAKKRSIVNKIMEDRDKHLSWIESEKSKSKKETPEEKANSFKEILMSMYKMHQNGVDFYDLGDMVYEWLKKTNKLSRTPETINTAVKYGHDKYFEEKASRSIRSKMYESVENEEDKERKKKKYARQYMIKLFFDNATIGEMINSIRPSDFEK
jgi:hypothetical protein